uniref:Uncharacterized protein n=1 Tax=Ditylenchus dipsaci TaxID=166011 RepID=A0A915E9R6_9BILA
MFSCKAALLLMCACVCLATDKICLPHQFCEADVNDPMVQKLASYIVEYVSTHIDGGHYVLKEVLSAQEQREEQQKELSIEPKSSWRRCRSQGAECYSECSWT